MLVIRCDLNDIEVKSIYEHDCYYLHYYVNCTKFTIKKFKCLLSAHLIVFDHSLQINVFCRQQLELLSMLPKLTSSYGTLNHFQ